jgi:hypothetical protein
MCCFVLVLGFLGPRVAFLVYWLLYPTRTLDAFDGQWYVPLIGVLLLPWTALAWVLLWPVSGSFSFDWLIIAGAFILDIATYFGRAAQNKTQSSSAA